MKSDLKPKTTLEELIPTDQHTLTDVVLLAGDLHRGKRGMKDLAQWEAGSNLQTNERVLIVRTRLGIDARYIAQWATSVYLVGCSLL